MSKLFFAITLSLDGFIAGENRGPQNPLGDGGEALHEWTVRQKAWREFHGMKGGEEGLENALLETLTSRPGAFIMGKRMFEEGEVHWPEDLFKAPVYVLTHEKREPWVQKGSTTFYFINEGLEKALALAKANAKGKDVTIQGGANIIQQYLNAGLVDDFTLHIAPIFLGSGIRLFDNIDQGKVRVEVVEAISSSLATHLSYKVTKKQ